LLKKGEKFPSKKGEKKNSRHPHAHSDLISPSGQGKQALPSKERGKGEIRLPNPNFGGKKKKQGGLRADGRKKGGPLPGKKGGTCDMPIQGKGSNFTEKKREAKGEGGPYWGKKAGGMHGTPSPHRKRKGFLSEIERRTHRGQILVGLENVKEGSKRKHIFLVDEGGKRGTLKDEKNDEGERGGAPAVKEKNP